MSLPSITFGPDADGDTWQSVLSGWTVRVKTKTSMAVGQVRSADDEGLVLSPVWDEESEDWVTERSIIIWFKNVVSVTVI